MQMNFILRRHALILGLAVAAVSAVPAFAQQQAQQPAATGCYSGPGFEAEKNAPCAPGTPSNAPVSPEAQKPGPYSSSESDTPEAKYKGCSPGQASNAPVNQAAQGPNANCYSTPNFDVEKKNAQ